MTLLVKEKMFYIHFFKLTLIIALQNVITIGVNLSDNIILGGYSETALSAAALANQIQFIALFLIIGCSQSVVILASRLWGSKQLHLIRKVIGVGMAASIVIGLITSITVILFSTELLSLLTADKSVIQEGAHYLKISSFSYVFFAITTILLASLRSMEIVKIGLLVSLFTLIINVSLNYLFVYGHFGLPRMGVFGSAIATLIARILECIIVIVYIVKNNHRLGLKMRHFFELDTTILKQYTKIALPILLSSLSWAGAMAVQSGILGHMGTSAIAANSVATTIFQFVTVIIYASASSTAIIMGKTIGEGSIEKVKAYSRTLQILYLFIGILTAIVLFVTKDHVLFLYQISDEAKALSLSFMTILSITAIGTAYEMPALSGIIQSGGDTKFVMYNDFIFMWLLILPASLLAAFVFNLSPVTLFILLKSDQILKCFVAFVKVNRYKWIKTMQVQR
ncbi:MATE family efflux transporter [Paenibacillus paeoniae]|uniref:MATE family efflux transporter n=1 Tax=Paenibacillus paeoniae TaxID=2292705 RepID=A0A371PH27_9BACL|nr:MATE family efflux transporter [Paenibacillus paeoniae]REK74690.1 MATE family efflux transporter [Paenibacillus paeoniae]